METVSMVLTGMVAVATITHAGVAYSYLGELNAISEEETLDKSHLSKVHERIGTITGAYLAGGLFHLICAIYLSSFTGVLDTRTLGIALASFITVLPSVIPFYHIVYKKLVFIRKMYDTIHLRSILYVEWRYYNGVHNAPLRKAFNKCHVFPVDQLEEDLDASIPTEGESKEERETRAREWIDKVGEEVSVRDQTYSEISHDELKYFIQ